MDHDSAAAQNMTERYLLDELDPATRDEFEEHYFNCTECAADVQAAAFLVDRIRDGAISGPEVHPVPLSQAGPPRPAWPAWLRPRFVVPVLAGLLLVVGYQNLVTYPRLSRQLSTPQILPWALVNFDTYGADGPTITSQPGQAFLLLVRIPRGGAYSKYAAELYDPAGKPEWSFEFATPSSSEQDQWPLRVPGGNRAAGRYTLKLRGITASGESKGVGETSFELQLQK